MSKPSRHSASKTSSNATLKAVLIVVGALALLGVIGAIVVGLAFSHIFKKAVKDSGVSIKDGTINVKNEKGEGSYSVGEQAKLPAGFPGDVPLYDPSKVTFASHSNGSYSATLASQDSLAQIQDYYKTQLVKAGWKSGSRSNYRQNNLQSSGGSYSKDSRNLILTLTANDNDQQTIIYISVSPSS